MSKQIDEKVVSLQFENEQFEKNVRTSMKTLENFEKASRLDGASKGLEDVERAANRLDFSTLHNSIDKLGNKFPWLKQIGIGIFREIGAQAEQTAQKILYSLTGIEQVTSGYGKYEEKIASVQTLVNATGKSVDEINGYLETLMRFSDETSYGFTDMASSLGQLASSGGDIDKLVPMIMGIANATAFAGKTQAEFKRAIYNLNQSYGAGALKYMDWKSLELAGVASKQLKEAFIETGKALGTLNKQGQAANGTLVEIGNFGETLKQNWATKEVMEQTFGLFYQYTKQADEMVKSGISETYTDAYKQMLEANAALADDVYFRAAKAAQEATTFQQVIVATKDAVSSKWMTTFDIVFGDYDEARKTWSALAEDFYNIFATGGDNRNDFLRGAFDSSYEQLERLLEESGVSIGTFEETFNKYLKSIGFNVDALTEQYGSLFNVIKNNKLDEVFGKGTSNKLIGDFFTYLNNGGEIIQKTVNSLEKLQQAFDDVWAGKYGNREARWNALAEAGFDPDLIQDLVNKHNEGYELLVSDIENLTDAQLENLGVSEEEIENFRKLAATAKEANTPLKNLLGTFGRDDGVTVLRDSILNITGTIINLKKTIEDAWKDAFNINFSGILYNLLTYFRDITGAIRDFTSENNTIQSIFKGIFIAVNTLAQAAGKLFGIVKSVFRQIGNTKVFTSLISHLKNLNINLESTSDGVLNFIDGFIKWFDESNAITVAIDWITEKIEMLIGFIGGLIDQAKSLPIVGDIIGNIENSVNTFSLKNITFDSVKQSFTDFFDTVKNTLSNFKFDTLFNFDSIREDFNKFTSDLSQGKTITFFENIDFKKSFENLAKGLGGVFGSLGGTFGKAEVEMTRGMDEALAPLGLPAEDLAKITKNLRSGIETLIGVFLAGSFLGAFKKLTDSLTNLAKPLVSFNDLLTALRSVPTAAAGALTELKGYFEQMKNNIKTENILKLAFSITLLVGAIFLLTKIDEEAMWKSVIAVGTLLLILSFVSNKMSEVRFNTNLDAKFTDIAVVLLSVAGSLILIAVALQMFGKIQNPVQAAVLALGSFIVLIVGLYALIKALDGKMLIGAGDAFKRYPKIILSIAASMFLIAIAFEKLAAIRIKSISSFFISLIGMIGAIVAISHLAGGISATSGLGLLGIAGALWLVSLALDKLQNADFSQYYKTLIKALPVFVLLGVLSLIVRGLTPKLTNLALFALALTSAAILFGFAVKTLAKINGPELAKGAAVVGGLMIVISVVSGMIMSTLMGFAVLQPATAKMGGAIAGMAVLIIAIAASIYLLVGAILIFKNMDVGGLAKGVGAVSVLLLAIGKMIGLMGQSLKDVSYNGLKAISSFIFMIAVVLLAVVGLSFIPLPNLIASTIGITAVLLSLATLFTAINMFTAKDMKQLGLALTEMAGIMIIVGGILYLLANNMKNPDAALQVAAALSQVMISLSEALVMISAAAVIARFAKGGVDALGQIIVVIGIISAIMIAISGLVDNAINQGNLKLEDLDMMILIVGKLGEFIGTFFGELGASLLGSFTTGIGESLVTFGKQLSDFASNVTGFTHMEIPETFGSTLASIISIITQFSLPGTKTALSYLTSGKVNWEKLNEFFEQFGQSMRNLSYALGTNFNSDAVSAASQAGNMFIELSNALSNTRSGGIAGFVDSIWNGSKETMEKFAQNMYTFADGLVKMSHVLTRKDGGFDASAIDAALKAGDLIKAFEDSMGRSGGLWQSIIGEKDLGDFGTRIRTFGNSIKALVDTMGGIKQESLDAAVAKATGVGETLKKLEDSIQDSKSLKGLIMGEDKNLGDFGARISQFVKGILEAFDAIQNGFTEQVRDTDGKLHDQEKFIDLDGLKKRFEFLKEIAGEFATLENDLAPTAGIFGSESQIGIFGQGLARFAGGIVDMSNILKGIDPPTEEQLKAFTDLSTLLVNISNTEGIENVSDKIGGLGDIASSIGAGFSELINSITNVGDLQIDIGDPTLSSMGGGGLATLLQNTFGNFDGAGIDIFGKEQTVATAQETLETVATTVTTSAQTGSLAQSKTKIEKFADEFAKKFDKQEEVKGHAVNIFKGFIEGTDSMMQSALDKIQEFADGVRDRLQFTWELHSPSKMTQRFGKFLVEGLTIGIETNKEMALDATEDMGLEVSNALMNAIQLANDTVENGQPIISPVLDMSNIQSGANAISSMLDTGASYNAALAVSNANARGLGIQNGGNVNPTVNIDFTVNNAGRDLTDSDIERYGRRIADIVNQQLGGMIG